MPGFGLVPFCYPDAMMPDHAFAALRAVAYRHERAKGLGDLEGYRVALAIYRHRHLPHLLPRRP